MTETMGKIKLAGFDLEPAEKAIVGNIIRNYEHKISERCQYEYIMLNLKKSRKGKTFLHEVKGDLKVKGKIMSAKMTDYNLFSALAEVMEKMLNEVEHRLRTARQV